MKKRIRIMLALVLMLTLVVTACGNSTPATTEGQSESTEGSQTEEKVLVIALEPDYFTFDPGYAYELYAPMIIGVTYDTLYEITPDSDFPAPQLASECVVSEDGLSYTFTINPNAVFASGNDVTSADVKFSFDRAKNLQSNASALLIDGEGNGIVDIETPDEDTVVIHLSKPDSSFISKTTSTSYAVLDSAIVIANGGISDITAPGKDTAQDYLNNQSAGSGPYIMESFSADDKLVLVKNKNYWGEMPDYDRIIIQDMPDANSQLISVQKGDIDIAFNLSADQIASVSSSSDVNVISGPTMTMGFLLMHNDPAIGQQVSDPYVQKAIRYALDYEGIHSIIGEGTVMPVSFIQSGFLGALDPVDVKTFRDLEKAKAFLAQSPYPDGFTIDFPVSNLAPEGIPLTLIAEKVKSDLQEIGININIVPRDWGGGYGDEYRDGTLGFTVMYWGPDYYDPNNQLAFLPGQFVGHRAGWTADLNPELAAMHEQIIRETDEAKRAELLGQVQMLTAENSPFIVYAQYPKYIVASKDVLNVEYSNVYRMDLTQLKKAD
ncbi:MAG: ABC transporter substrate-binding protein [Tissierellales bacterium]|nr:ABC transporter substrate-binding protein [Tissierellales bacterium]MBN2828494.1 ABC transporter substrate-binding protein [Tissierellales bacterium]